MNSDLEEARVVLDKVYSRDHDITAAEIETLQRLIQSEDREIVEPASRALAEVAKDTPERVVGSVSDLADLLDHDDPQTRANALRALAGIAPHSPSLIEPYSRTFVDNLMASHSLLQRTALEGIRGISAEDPNMMVSHIDQLKRVLFDESGPYLEKPALDVLSNIAEGNPAEVASIASKLVEVAHRTDDRAIRNRIIELLSILVNKDELGGEFEQEIQKLRD